MIPAERQLNYYWTLMAETHGAEYADEAHTRFCVRNELRALFDGPPPLTLSPRLAKLCRDAFDATFVAEFGADGAAAGRAEHERLDAELLSAMQKEEEGEDNRAYKAWRTQFALTNKRRA
jgi:hypothetical protein